MRKILISLALTLIFAVTANAAMTVAWDTYTDPVATGLRLESSTDNSTWTTAVGDIPTSMVASDIPNGPDNTRVYYRMVAFNASEDADPSNIISFYWTTGGNGFEKVAPATGIKFLDCASILLDNTDPDYGTCLNRYVP